MLIVVMAGMEMTVGVAMGMIVSDGDDDQAPKWT